MNEAWDNMTNEQLCLEYQATRSDELYEYFLKRNKDLMYSFFGPYIRRFPDQEDTLEQRGRLAMWETMVKLDPERGQFSTAFYIYAKKNVNHHYEEQFLVRLPRWVFSNGNLEKLREDPNYVTGWRSLTEVLYPGEGPGEDVLLQDYIASSEPTPEEIGVKEAEKQRLMKHISKLKPREQKCVIMYFGLDGHDGNRTLQEVGDYYGVTRERIRQILSKAIRKLHFYYLKEGGRDGE